ncbi:hypothetical protein TanjilG_22745 [Lupinus angustifolius]|uniref:Glycosyltransferase n=1 Tax=Lupinus angustifolius TaxID=3871 RepID=A0A4P1RI05_LUPAN|nr:PREDICTED: UDP-glycosyltransferase 84B2-like [Lupinus angustifolius]OIW10938.1 hypothetical protein TanjilG_22745 [Lupinus angustifolius]
MATESKVNVLMVTTALQSHINPMLRFAKRLVPKGVHVTLITTETARDRMLGNNNNVSDTTNQEEIQFEFFSDGLSNDFDRNKDKTTFIDTLRTIGAKNLSNLINNLSKTKGQNYSCMIVDPLLPWAIDVSSDLGIPCALLWLQPCAIYFIGYHWYKNPLVFQNLEDPNEEVQLPGLPLLEAKDVPTYLLPDFPAFGKQVMAEIYQGSEKLKWVFAMSNSELEEEIVKFMTSFIPICPIGPLVSQFMLGEKETNGVIMNLWTAESSCLEWLDDKPDSSVIYISFGSVIAMSQKQVNNLATALKNSNKSFLWVIKPAEKGSEDEIPEIPLGFLEETKGKGLVVTWCEQEKVLMHPAVACFMTHCGWNSMLETIAAGVPIIAYPKWLDQPTNAKLIVKQFRNGVVMNCGEDSVASVEEIEGSIKEVMEGSSAVAIKKVAMEMKEAAREALQEGGSSDNNINQFVNELKNIVNADSA